MVLDGSYGKAKLERAMQELNFKNGEEIYNDLLEYKEDVDLSNHYKNIKTGFCVAALCLIIFWAIFIPLLFLAIRFNES